ncbi:hypothetical protein ACHAXR_011280 [Thalassiosira sp. AJA248-18]
MANLQFACVKITKPVIDSQDDNKNPANGNHDDDCIGEYYGSTKNQRYLCLDAHQSEASGAIIVGGEKYQPGNAENETDEMSTSGGIIIIEGDTKSKPTYSHPTSEGLKVTVPKLGIDIHAPQGMTTRNEQTDEEGLEGNTPNHIDNEGPSLKKAARSSFDSSPTTNQGQGNEYDCNKVTPITFKKNNIAILNSGDQSHSKVDATRSDTKDPVGARHDAKEEKIKGLDMTPNVFKMETPGTRQEVKQPETNGIESEKEGTSTRTLIVADDAHDNEGIVRSIWTDKGEAVDGTMTKNHYDEAVEQDDEEHTNNEEGAAKGGGGDLVMGDVSVGTAEEETEAKQVTLVEYKKVLNKEGMTMLTTEGVEEGVAVEMKEEGAGAKESAMDVRATGRNENKQNFNGISIKETKKIVEPDSKVNGCPIIHDVANKTIMPILNEEPEKKVVVEQHSLKKKEATAQPANATASTAPARISTATIQKSKSEAVIMSKEGPEKLSSKDQTTASTGTALANGGDKGSKVATEDKANGKNKDPKSSETREKSSKVATPPTSAKMATTAFAVSAAAANDASSSNGKKTPSHSSSPDGYRALDKNMTASLEEPAASSDLKLSSDQSGNSTSTSFGWGKIRDERHHPARMVGTGEILENSNSAQASTKKDGSSYLNDNEGSTSNYLLSSEDHKNENSNDCIGGKNEKANHCVAFSDKIVDGIGGTSPENVHEGGKVSSLTELHDDEQSYSELGTLMGVKDMDMVVGVKTVVDEDAATADVRNEEEKASATCNGYGVEAEANRNFCAKKSDDISVSSGGLERTTGLERITPIGAKGSAIIVDGVNEFALDAAKTSGNGTSVCDDKIQPRPATRTRSIRSKTLPPRGKALCRKIQQHVLDCLFLIAYLFTPPLLHHLGSKSPALEMSGATSIGNKGSISDGVGVKRSNHTNKNKVYANIEDNAAQSLALSNDDLPGSGWKKRTVLTGNRNRTLWISPERGIEFFARNAAFQFEGFRVKFSDEMKAWPEYRAWKKSLREFVCVRNPKQYDGDRVDIDGSLSTDETDECYVCCDGGDLVLCDHCSKAFHLQCHIPKLLEVPKGQFRCCECIAVECKRKRRCGECHECTRPDCGTCGYCQSKRAHGGNGSYGKPCKFKRCKNMRFAAPERHIISAKRATKQTPTNKKSQAAFSKKVKVAKAKFISKVKIAASASHPPGPGWQIKLVPELGPNRIHIQNRCHWISPVRKIEFRRRTQACEFEGLRQKFGTDEVRAWAEYRRKYNGRDYNTKVVSATQYDVDSPTPTNKKRQVTSSKKARVPVAVKLMPKGKIETRVSAKRSTKQTPTNKNSQSSSKKAKFAKLMSKVKTDESVSRRPGPGWQNKLVPELGLNRGPNRCHWISPVRKMEFRRRTQACEFEALRQKFGTDEIRAWAEYRRKYNGRNINTQVVSATQYDPPTLIKKKRQAASSTKAKLSVSVKSMSKIKINPRRHLPGQGWQTKVVSESGVNLCHWISPMRKIEFKRRTQACEFEALRQKFGTNEVRAWTEFRHQYYGCKNLNVVSPMQYDVDPPTLINKKSQAASSKKAKGSVAVKLISKVKIDARVSQPPGPGWQNKLVPELRQNRCHWISPMRKIEFRRQTQACEFEALRQKFGTDEVRAWTEYRHKYSGRERSINVISPRRYDVDPLKRGTKRKLVDHSGPASKLARTCAKSTQNKSEVRTPRFNGRRDDKLASLSPGWKSVTRGSELKQETHYQTPKLGISFRSYASALEFDATLRIYPHDETRAVDEHIKKIGTSKFRNAVSNLGGYTSKWKNGTSEPSGKASTKTTQTTRTKYKPPVPASKNTNMIESPFKDNPPNPDNGLNCSCYKIIRPKQVKKVSFFEERFQNRILRVESSLSDETCPDKTIIENGKKYTLASAKVDKKSGRSKFGNDNRIELIYVQTRCLQRELEKLCSFSVMRPEKIVARLGHLQSEAQYIKYTEHYKIEEIEEEGNEGCGYYPEDFFGSGSRKKYDAIQVRIISPKIGLVKGMLLKKRGIHCIQIPPSMIKAPPSKTCKEGWAAVVIKNVFPSDENNQLGRDLDPDATAPGSWKDKDRKQLSTMYQRMLIGFGVKKGIVDTYTKQSRMPKNLRHAHIKGVIDPTGKLPENKVFVSGYVAAGRQKRELFGKVHKKIYLSRSPCLDPRSDAKLVSTVGSKPRDMSPDDWDMLCSYDFGTIVFPRPRENSDPLSRIIADGDLDGDDYFVLWDEKILGSFSVESKRLLQKLELPSGVQHSVNKKTKYSKVSDPRWLSKAQSLMLDFPTQHATSQIVGKLWSLCINASKRDDGGIDIFDEDAIAYASCVSNSAPLTIHIYELSAYKNALDVQKHGGKITLPSHLHENLSESHQALLK